MSKIYIGIDPSFTNTGMVAIDGDKAWSKEVSFPKINGPRFGYDDNIGETARLKTAAVIFRDILYNMELNGKTPVFGIEVPIGSHMGGGAKLDRLYAVMVLVLPEIPGTGDRIRTYTPSQIKKFYTDHGNADKELMVWFANNVWDFKTTSHDLADAHAIAKLTQYIDEGKYEL